ncbi:MAG: AmmeMemoRadiSam system radical SAM enzyme [Patescibacteria group bacterium]
MKEAYLYKKLKDKTIRCEVCAHNCLIALGKRGFCGVRENQNGKLYSLVYGKIIAAHIDPIEKKPFFHWLPGSFSLSIATVGCNFRCLHCQNYEISQMPRDTNGQILGEEISPKEIVNLAKKNNLLSISYTYTEPTIFLEFAFETMKLAKKEGLKNNWVTNGYMSKKTLELIGPYLDAANVDLKFFQNDLYQKVCGAKLQPVLDSLKWMKKNKIWVEVTTLVIPGYTEIGSQFEDIANFIKNELGSETPWHISRFYPAYKMIDVSPTPTEIIYRAYEIGKKIGLKYVYAGNLPGDSRENTYCPKCGELNIKRIGYDIERFDKNGKCRKCNENLDLILN